MVSVHPLGDLGAEVTGIRLDGDVPSQDLNVIVEAWWRYAVLIFPEQHFDDERQVAFTRLLGPLERSENGGPVIRFSTLGPDGEAVSSDDAAARILTINEEWHTDSSFKPVGAAGSLLSAKVVPRTGGATEWADMRAAYDALDPATRAEIEDWVAVHDLAKDTTGPYISEEHRRRFPSSRHRVVRVHTVTGRRSLYIGRHAAYVVGQDPVRSAARLAQLTQEACQPPRVFRHSWRVGDAVLWDNRCVLHRSTPWPVDEPRVVHRTTMAGEDGEKRSGA